MFKQQTVKIIDLQKNIWDYTTEELKAIIGNFEKEYSENATGKTVRNEILGWVKEGTIKRALMMRAIVKHEVDGKDIYFINLPEYRDYQEKHNALRELISRRSYAKRKDLENLESNL